MTNPTATPAAPAEPQSAPLLDLGRALDFVGDEDGVHAMIPMFQAALGSDVPEILRLLQAGDVQAANQLLHPLKGFVPVFCVDALIDRVTEVEVLSKTATAAQVLPRFTAIVPLLTQLHAEVSDYMRSRGL